MTQWVVVSKDIQVGIFYPSSILRGIFKTLLTYDEAREKSLNYWKDKNVIFHAIWKGEYFDKWRNDYRRYAEHSKNFWIEFDADNHLNNLHNIDLGTGKCFNITEFITVTDKFIWEASMKFNPFPKPIVKVPLRIYDPQREVYANPDRKIDFLGFIDSSCRNVVQTLQILENLNKEYTVKCLILNDRIFNLYNGKLPYDLILNSKFNDAGQKKFWSLCRDSKVFIDLSTRLTTGRTIYESFFNGNLCICPQSYGVSEILFPDLSIDTFYMDVPLVEEKCKQLLAIWSPDEVKLRREHAREHAIPKVMIDELKAKSE